MSFRTFGRAQVQEALVPGTGLAWNDSWSADPESNRRWIIFILASPLLILLVDSLFSGTELISPIGKAYLWWMRALGLADGIALLFFLRASLAYQARNFARRLLIVLIGPFFMVAAFD